MLFRKLLVANRGVIAVRVLRACRELGIATVAVYSDADAQALHVLEADEAVRIGPPPPSASYLNGGAIIAAARSTGAEAVHPGYGFLSENADFAEACLAAGLAWVGPPPTAMRAMASKSAAKRLAAALGVPLLPGYQGEDQSDATLTREAERVGYPLLVKAAAGGGGRGMRIVEQAADLADALAAARREARSAFADDTLLLERYVRRPRHIEIQVLADAHGQVIHLGERDCSAQRRHQKVIEEAPAPALPPATRAAMGDAAVRLATAIGYVNAGTVEFILDEDGRFAFLEMNTRLQVEHGVTELVTGLDLVHLQLRVAAGEPLPFRQEEIRAEGHAIQCRVYAEDAARGYLPSSGDLTRFQPPAGPGLRNEVGFYAGATVPSDYDALLAKLLVHGRTRDEAIARTLAALAAYEVAGVVTNLPLLRAAVDAPAFRAGGVATDFLASAVVPLLGPPTADTVRAALLGAAAHDLTRPESRDPWASGPWRVAGVGVPLAYVVAGERHALTAHRRAADAWELCFPAAVVLVHLTRVGEDRLLVATDATRTGYRVTEQAGGLLVGWAGGMLRVERAPPPSPVAPASAATGRHRTLVAPLAGVVVRVLAAAGAAVAARQPLVLIEAMKMEHTVEAPAAGQVARVAVTAGDRVQAGDLLVELE